MSTWVVFGFASVAAAADQDEGKDNQPDPVIVQQIAETGIHNRSSLSECKSTVRYSSITFYDKGHETCVFLSKKIKSSG